MLVYFEWFYHGVNHQLHGQALYKFDHSFHSAKILVAGF